MSFSIPFEPPKIPLPQLPPVVEEIVHLASFTTGRGKLHDLLSRDPEVAAKVVALADVVCPPSFPGPIREVGQAVLALDARTLKGLALCIPLADLGRLTFPLLSPVRFWRHAVLTGLITRWMATTLSSAHPEETFIGALLHDAGIALLVKKNASAFGEIALPWSEGSPAGLRGEHTKLQSTHPETGYDLSIHWRLPTLVGECIRHHHSPTDQLRRDFAADVRGAISVVQYADTCSRHYGHSIGKFDLVDPSHPPAQEGITRALTGVEAMVHKLGRRLTALEPVFFQETATGPEESAPTLPAEQILQLSLKIQSFKDSITHVPQVSERKAGEFNQLLRELGALGLEVKEWWIPHDALTAASTFIATSRKNPSKTVLPGNYLPRDVLMKRIEAVLAKLQEICLSLEGSIAWTT